MGYALGPNALTNPYAATEISRITLGTFTPVRNPGDVITYLQNVSFTSVDDVIFTGRSIRAALAANSILDCTVIPLSSWNFSRKKLVVLVS